VSARVPAGVTRQELARFARSGAGARVGFGRRPALLIVDVTRAFADDAYPLSIGPDAPTVVAAIRRLLLAARRAALPVIHVTGSPLVVADSIWTRKHARPSAARRMADPRAHAILPPLRPAAGEPHLVKTKPSAFFGTPLGSVLVARRVDTVIVTGLVTSGCIRATAVDAFSHGYRVVIPEECVGDRVRLSHDVSLFDLRMKYADVLPLARVLRAIGGRGGA
jgi:nicotinamidase-related amidase